MKQEWIRVGRIVHAHGIRGEVRVQPRDGDPRPFSPECQHLLCGRRRRRPHRQPRPQGAWC